MIPLHRLLRLSRRFGEAQFFASHRVVSSYAWARAARGVVEREAGASIRSGSVAAQPFRSSA